MAALLFHFGTCGAWLIKRSQTPCQPIQTEAAVFSLGGGIAASDF
jgi:hypothetical protein